MLDYHPDDFDATRCQYQHVDIVLHKALLGQKVLLRRQKDSQADSVGLRRRQYRQRVYAGVPILKHLVDSRSNLLLLGSDASLVCVWHLLLLHHLLDRQMAALHLLQEASHVRQLHRAQVTQLVQVDLASALLRVYHHV